MFDKVTDDQILADVPSAEIETLREECKAWSPEQWESYLLSIVVPLKEKLVSERKYARISESSGTCVFDFSQRSSPNAVRERIALAFEELNKRERVVLDLIYFKSKTYRQAALELKVSVAGVFKIQVNAVRKIRRALLKGVNALPLVKGQIETSQK